MMRVAIDLGDDCSIVVKIDDPYSPDVLEDLISRTVIGAVTAYRAEALTGEADS